MAGVVAMAERPSELQPVESAIVEIDTIRRVEIGKEIFFSFMTLSSTITYSDLTLRQTPIPIDLKLPAADFLICYDLP